jgi:hypothetical protein
METFFWPPEETPTWPLTANGLATDRHMLGEMQAARDLHRDTFARQRRVLGNDHRDTLRSASNLAADLRAIGADQAARELEQDIQARWNQARGEHAADSGA